jgi:uncharacterized protein (DUF2062 family)
MQRWLKSNTPDRHTLEKLWCLKPFASLVVDRGCWAFRRTSVIRAFSLGLLIAFVPPTPFLPLHLALCAVLGILLRLNIPVLVATVFVSNPFTWFPQVAGSIWVGAKLMGLNIVPMLHELSHRNFRGQIHQLWEPLLLGALVLGICAAALGYVVAQCVWRARVVYLLRRRRLRSSPRRAAFD